jgi:hypothetical protein
MKGAQAQALMQDLLARCVADDAETCEYALFQAAILLDQAHTHQFAGMSEMREEALGRDLGRIRLRAQDRQRLADAVFGLILAQSTCVPTAWWVLEMTGPNDYAPALAARWPELAVLPVALTGDALARLASRAFAQQVFPAEPGRLTRMLTDLETWASLGAGKRADASRAALVVYYEITRNS